jgi:hypothetical protein
MSETSENSGEVVSAAIESDSELNAMRSVLSALVPLKREGRSRVLDYVLKRLGMQGDQITQTPAGTQANIPGSPELPGIQRGADIRSLTNEKSPGSAIEMAALVAYYLSEAAPESERNDAVNTEDIKKYFKQAQFKLPSRPEMALVNAKNAGYFESVGGGQYKLNPVGYNLVAHNLPAGNARAKPGKAKKKKKKAKKRK